jgi:probable HAF family extracellular repeat protein
MKWTTALIAGTAIVFAACTDGGVTKPEPPPPPSPPPSPPPPPSPLVIRSERDSTLTADTLKVGGNVWLRVSGVDSSATVVWSVNDTAVAGIQEKQRARLHLNGRKIGNATITANVVDRAGTFPLVVQQASATNHPPVARVEGPTSGVEGAALTFNAKASSDPDHDVLRYAWSFGDGAAKDSGSTVTHTYTEHASRTVSVVVTDPGGLADTASMNVVITQSSNVNGFEAIDLGTLGGSSAIARAVNDAGQVVGCSQTTSGRWQAFVWSDGTMRPLGSGTETSCAWAINNSGTIAGVTGEIVDGDHVVAWNSKGESIDLGASPCCWESVGFVAVTDAGDIVGGGTDEGHSFASAIWQNGVKRDIPSPLPNAGYSAARAVNNRAQVVGYSAIASYVGTHIEHAFIWEDGKTRDLGLLDDRPCPDEPARSCTDAFAIDINTNGVVVGVNQDASHNYRGVRWMSGTVDVLGSWQPVAINDAGDIIGNGIVGSPQLYGGASVTEPAPYSASGDAYFWRGGTVTKLNSFNGSPTRVIAINGSSTVTGWSEDQGKNPRVFVWTPGQSQLLDLGVGPQGLNQLGAVATAINARGDIIGYTVGTCRYNFDGMCWAWNGPTRAILWRKTVN